MCIPVVSYTLGRRERDHELKVDETMVDETNLYYLSHGN